MNEGRLRFDPNGATGVPYLVRCLDAKGKLSDRTATRGAHLEYLEASGAVGLAGPLRPIDGDDPCGSLILINGHSTAGVTAFTQRDPYALKGIFREVKVIRARNVDVTGLYNVEFEVTSSLADGEVRTSSRFIFFELHRIPSCAHVVPCPSSLNFINLPAILSADFPHFLPLLPSACPHSLNPFSCLLIRVSTSTNFSFLHRPFFRP